MNHLSKGLFLPALLLMLTLLALGCGSSTKAIPATPEGAGEEAEEEAGHLEEPAATLSEAALRGQAVFSTVGCANCHGENAVGTDIAPGLSGHTETQVRRQVRAPVGVMPVFSPERLTDLELADLISYVATLTGGHGHVKTSDVGAEMQMHHWMALFAIEDEEVDEGRHHIQHIVDLTEGEHRFRMQEVLDNLAAGDLHGAAHTVEQMLAGVIGDSLAEATMHLNLALSSTKIGDGEGTAHHLTHFNGLAQGAEVEAGEAILALVSAGNLDEAAHELEELLAAAGVAPDAEGHDD